MEGTERIQCHNPNPSYRKGRKGKSGDQGVKNVIGMQSLKSLTMFLVTNYATLQKQSVVARTRDIALNPISNLKDEKWPHGSQSWKTTPKLETIHGSPRVERSLASIEKPTYFKQTHKLKNKKKATSKPTTLNNPTQKKRLKGAT